MGVLKFLESGQNVELKNTYAEENQEQSPTHFLGCETDEQEMGKLICNKSEPSSLTRILMVLESRDLALAA